MFLVVLNMHSPYPSITRFTSEIRKFSNRHQTCEIKKLTFNFKFLQNFHFNDARYQIAGIVNFVFIAEFNRTVDRHFCTGILSFTEISDGGTVIFGLGSF